MSSFTVMAAPISSVIFLTLFKPVSYTHLDVYKRQPPYEILGFLYWEVHEPVQRAKCTSDSVSYTHLDVYKRQGLRTDKNKKQSSDSGGNSWLSSCRKSAGGSYHQVSLCFCRSEAGS